MGSNHLLTGEHRLEPLTADFRRILKEVLGVVQAGVTGLAGENLRFFAELLVTRMLFLKFIERKGWLDGDTNYLYHRFIQHRHPGYWKHFLLPFFLEGLNTEPTRRSAAVRNLLGEIPFLNRELFARSDKWDDHTVSVDNTAFDRLFTRLLNPCLFAMGENPLPGAKLTLHRDVLGYGYEALIAQRHRTGAYYTLPTEVDLMCRESLRAYLESRCPGVAGELIGRLVYGERSPAADESRPAEFVALALYQALHDVRIVDPALGAGTFPVAMLRHLFSCLHSLGRQLGDSPAFQAKVRSGALTSPFDSYQLKLHIIERSLFGCDVNAVAVQVAKMRFGLELLANCEKPAALPNLDFNFVVGDALISAVGTGADGRLITLEEAFGHSVHKGPWPLDRPLADRLSHLKRSYFAARDTEEELALSDQIERARQALLQSLPLNIPVSEQTDKHVLWHIDFAEMFADDEPGFDIVIGNPPYLRQELIDGCFAEYGSTVRRRTLQQTYNETLQVAIGGQADLCIYFYFRSLMLCKADGGIVCLVSSNSWLDAGYGNDLRRFLLKHAHIRAIIENRSKRSFASADINSIIALLVRQSERAGTPPARFIALRRPFEEFAMESLMRRATSLEDSHHEEQLTINVIPTGKLFDFGRGARRVPPPSSAADLDLAGTRWGGVCLRAPRSYFEALKLGRMILTPLDSLATIHRGFTTGANEFFFLTPVRTGNGTTHCRTDTGEEFELEDTFLKPVMRNTRECRKHLVEAADTSLRLFVCKTDRGGLKGSCTLDYIEWGERQHYHARPTCRSRARWWDLGQRSPQPLWWIIAHHDRDGCLLNRGVRCSDNFFEITPGRMISDVYLFAVLTSSWATLQRELLGRVGFGGGLLKTQGPDLRRMLIPDPRRLSQRTITAVEELGRALLPLPPARIHDAWTNGPRADLDRIIVRAIGLGEEAASQIFEAAGTLVRERQQRAASVPSA